MLHFFSESKKRLFHLICVSPERAILSKFAGAALFLMRRHIVSLLAVIALLGAGCNRQSSDSEPEITSIHMAGVYADSARVLAAEFQRQTGIRVKIVSAPYLTLREKELTELLNGSCHYDVMQIAQQWDGEMQPHLWALDDLIAEHGPNLRDFIPSVRPKDAESKDRTYALPISCDAITLLYRTDVFAARAAEFKLQTGRSLEPPRTWEEYIELARFFNSESLYGNIIMGLKEQNFTVWEGILRGMGGQLVDEHWRPLLNSEAGIRSLSLFVNMFRYAPPGSRQFSTEEANTMFLQGKGAMYLTWPSLIWAQMNDTNLCRISGKIAASVIPGGRPQISFWSLGINRACPAPEKAYQWIRFFLNETNTKRLLLDYGKGPSLVSTYQDEECRRTILYLPQVLKGLEGGQPRFRIPPSQELCDYLDDQIADAIAGRISPKVALDRAAADWRAVLEQAGYLKE
jgi:multiple sugar transport system substrate-binding protein